MRVALEVWSSSYSQLESTCRLAESLGLDGFYYGESPHDLNLDCWTTLAALARCTECIRLGPVITNILPTYRSTALLAKQVATVAAISDGRIDFRTGVGAAASFGRRWWEPFGVNYPDYDERLADLGVALTELERLWDGRSRLSCIANCPPIPITIAATGDRALRLAATEADGWETSFCTPSEFKAQNARLTEMVRGREVTRSLEIDGFVSQTSVGLSRLLDRFRSDRGGAEDLDPVLDRALVGVPDQAVNRLGELEAAGVEQVVVALHDPHDPDAIAALAETAALLLG
jgi:alkanesulfonate monooxygenase SsuD/methylene tetrahydromethanopterin reductase-like flavin-dependent oxidoreductase (luciferase family)